MEEDGEAWEESSDDEYDESGNEEEEEGMDIDEEFDAHEVAPRLYLGSVLASKNKDKLLERGITHILIVSGMLLRYHPHDFSYWSVDLDDTPTDNLLAVLPECITFLTSALAQPTNKVLVHCQAGVSRSASVVSAYLMARDGIGFTPALARVQAARMVYPNEGFRAQLQDLETFVLSDSDHPVAWAKKEEFLFSPSYAKCLERKKARDAEKFIAEKKTPLFELVKRMATASH